MHRDTADSIVSQPSIPILAIGRFVENADRSGFVAVIDELRGVMKNENRGSRGCCKPLLRRLKVTSQNLRLADTVIGKEPVCRLGVRPILARPRNTPTDFLRQL